MYKAVFIDIDGTLKNDKGQITDRTKEERKRIKDMKQTAFIDDLKSGILKV